MPDCDAIQVPKLDPEVKDQLKKKGRNLQFGMEQSLFKIQEQMLKVTGPLTCLWSDLQYAKDKPTCEQMVHLIQRALVLLGNTSHSINIERQRFAWNRINPTLKSLAVESYGNCKRNLFGPRFLEKASKKLDAGKAMAKVTPLTIASTHMKRTQLASVVFREKAPWLTAAVGSSTSESHTTSRTSPTRSQRLTLTPATSHRPMARNPEPTTGPHSSSSAVPANHTHTTSRHYPSFSGEGSTVPTQLKVDNDRPMGLAGGTGIPESPW